ncbi:MAG: DUF1015 domain-containing protein [Clostridiales bacterium]|jgi:hypothetical protein|nr:DUF1015 domain-containing protein [Clostridiales bacterium]
MENVGFYRGNILLPRKDFSTWSVVACDQFTSQPEYWQEVERQVAGRPSAYEIIFPEAYLERIDFDDKIASINQTMEKYWEDDIFEEHPDCMIYTERTLKNGKVRKGIVGLLDLEQYDFQKGSSSLVRATEGTILDRLPPRIKIRQNALLESPHIMILIDDEQKKIVEPLHQVIGQRQKLYDFSLMQDGGYLAGYLLTAEDMQHITEGLCKLADPERFQMKYEVQGASPLVFAVGDGNHSLATAKRCYEQIKETLPLEEALQHPARYALVELNNLHDDSLEFEAIHRAVFEVDPQQFLQEFQKYCQSVQGEYEEQQLTVVIHGEEIPCSIPHPEHTLTIGSVQQFLDQYLSQHGGKVDYIHGEDVVKALSQKGAVGILVPCMEKADLFRTVILEGALPRKTFSMGEANDKRYYLECRKIR